MAKDSKDTFGKPTLDDRGNPSWQWAEGVDTARVRTLGGRFSLRSPARTGSDPYNMTAPARVTRPRRSLDDMRRLSELIKQRRIEEAAAAARDEVPAEIDFDHLDELDLE